MDHSASNKPLSGNEMRALRTTLELDQTELAELLGVSRASIIRWEQAGCASPSRLLEALREGAARGVLPRPVDRTTRWGWLSGLLQALHRAETPPVVASPLTADEVLTALRHLDQEQRGENCVPIYLLREHFGDRVTRPTLDALLVQLVREHRLRMSTLQETHLYTPAQYAAGIPSPVGGPRFFLIVLPQ